MTNLAYLAEKESKSLRYPDFSKNAAYQTACHKRKALGIQRRYGALMLLICAAAIGVSLLSEATDLTALLVLLPLSLYLLLSKQVLLYQPY